MVGSLSDFGSFGARISADMRVPSLLVSAVRKVTPSGRLKSGYFSLFSGLSPSFASGRPKQRTLPVFCFGKKLSNSLGVNRVLPPPTYTRPRDSDGPAHTGPRTISLS